MVLLLCCWTNKYLTACDSDSVVVVVIVVLLDK